jgi:transcriptional regulator with XRE-family HTH domain
MPATTINAVTIVSRPTMPTSLGERLRALREEKDLSLREFARRLNRSPAFISDVELGRRYPSEPLLSQMASVLSTTVGDLKAYDVRLPTEEMKRLAAADPRYGVAFRTVIDKKIPAQDILDFANRVPPRSSRGSRKS